MFKALLFAIAFCMAGGTMAQTSTADSVKKVINNYIAAMHNSYGQGILDCFTEFATMQTIAHDKNGAAVIKNDKYTQIALVVAGIPKGAAEERFTFDMLKIDGPLASVWISYKFYMNSQFSHCGATSFQLVRINNQQWKILYVVDTRRKQPCE